MQIRYADDEASIARCHPVLHQLRPHLDEPTLVAQVMRQRAAHGYRLVYLEEDGKVLACAGYRVAEWLAWGKALYVDDLVTDEVHRSRGCGDKLFEHLLETARLASCTELHLDSGVTRYDAHRFYLRWRMEIRSHHFRLDLRVS